MNSLTPSEFPKLSFYAHGRTHCCEGSDISPAEVFPHEATMHPEVDKISSHSLPSSPTTSSSGTMLDECVPSPAAGITLLPRKLDGDELPQNREHQLSQVRTEDSIAHHNSNALVVTRTPTATQPPSFSALHESAFVAVVSAAQLLTQAGLGQAIAPLHVIGNSFNTTNPGQLSWLPAAYSLTVGTFILPAGRWGDLYGHKKLFVIGWLWFSVWSVVAGTAVYTDSLVFFAFCRAMQGIGPALLLPNGIAVLSRTYPPGPRREMILSIFGATAPGGFVLGAVFSGICAQFTSWQWAYWVLGIVAAGTAIAAIFVIPNMPVVGSRPSFKELDPYGTVLGVLGLILFNISWNEGPVVGWDQFYVYVILIVSVVVLAAFFWVETRRAEYPLLPVTAFTRDTNLVFGCVALGWASFGIWVFYFWQFMELERGQSILESSAQSVPTAISGCIAAITTGFIIGKIQPGWIMLTSMTAFMVGTILLATAPVEQTYWAQLFVAAIVTPWGMDMSFPSGVIVLANHMPKEQQGLAASLVNTVINYSISIGLGMAGTVEVHVNDGGANALKGYRGAWYLGVGLDALGIACAIGLIISWRLTHKEEPKPKVEEKV